MLGVISDVHANYEALSAVLEELQGLKAERIICLGDIVGYGPDPEKCIDTVQQECDMTLCGNHDFALIYGATDFSASASEAIAYHRQRLMPHFNNSPQDEVRLNRWHFLKGLPSRYKIGNCLFVHGSPRNPRNEYLRERDVKWQLDTKLEENFDLVDFLCFVGHTHRPGVFTEDLKYYKPEQLGNLYRPTPGLKAIINVGSVGQPRDNDTRASFVTVEDTGVIRFHRATYDIEVTIAKMEQVGLLNPKSVQRLRMGQ